MSWSVGAIPFTKILPNAFLALGLELGAVGSEKPMGVWSMDVSITTVWYPG